MLAPLCWQCNVFFCFFGNAMHFSWNSFVSPAEEWRRLSNTNNFDINGESKMRQKKKKKKKTGQCGWHFWVCVCVCEWNMTTLVGQKYFSVAMSSRLRASTHETLAAGTEAMHTHTHTNNTQACTHTRPTAPHPIPQHVARRRGQRLTQPGC